jgi:hypothetical protein
MSSTCFDFEDSFSGGDLSVSLSLSLYIYIYIIQGVLKKRPNVCYKDLNPLIAHTVPPICLVKQLKVSVKRLPTMQQNFTHTHAHAHAHSHTRTQTLSHTRARTHAHARARTHTLVLQALHCHFVTNPTNSLCRCSVQRM